MFLRHVFAAAACLFQDFAVEVVAPPEGRGPCVVACGFAPEALLRGARERTVRCVDAFGKEARGAFVRRESGVVLLAAVDGLPPGVSVLRTRAGPPLDLADAAPRLLEQNGEVVVSDGGGPYARLLRGGVLEIDGLVVGFRGAAFEDETWRVVDRNPIRATAVFEAPGALPDGRLVDCSLVASFEIVERRVALTAIVRVPKGAGGPFDLALTAADGAARLLEAEGGATLRATYGADGGPSAEDPSDDDASGDEFFERAEAREQAVDPTFERFVESLRGSRLKIEGRFGGRFVRRSDAPGRSPKYVARGDGFVAFGLCDSDDDLDEGEERRIDVAFTTNAEREGRTIARPATFPKRTRGALRFGRASRDLKLKAWSAALKKDLEAWRGSPKHGLGYRRGDGGDWFMGQGRAGNLEWDTAFGLAARFMDVGDPIDLFHAEAAVDHLLARDRDARSGLFFVHGAGHRTGRVEIGHHWTEGLRLVLETTDDPSLRLAVARVANDQADAFKACDLAAALPRSLGWGLLSLSALHPFATDKEASAAAIARFRARVASSATREGHLDLERFDPSPTAPFRVSPFVVGGIVLPAFVSTAAIPPTRDEAALARRVGRALLSDAYAIVEGRRVLRSSLFCDPARGRVVGSSGEATGEERLLFLAGLSTLGREFAPSQVELSAAEATRAAPSKVFLGKEISTTLRALASLADS